MGTLHDMKVSNMSLQLYCFFGGSWSLIFRVYIEEEFTSCPAKSGIYHRADEDDSVRPSIQTVTSSWMCFSVHTHPHLEKIQTQIVVSKHLYELQQTPAGEGFPRKETQTQNITGTLPKSKLKNLSRRHILLSGDEETNTLFSW